MAKTKQTKPKKEQNEQSVDLNSDINQNSSSDDHSEKEASPKKKRDTAKKNGVQKAKKTGKSLFYNAKLYICTHPRLFYAVVEIQ